MNFDATKERSSPARLTARGARVGARDLLRLSRARAVIFDMDGVLADTEEYHLESWRSCLHSRYGLAPAPEVIRSTFGQSNEKILPLLVPGAEPSDLPRLSDEKEAFYREAARGRVRPLAGIERFLRWLSREGIPLAVGTSGPAENIRFLLAEFGWRRLFSALVDRGQFAASKPAPDCFLAAAARLGIPPERCLVFEDSLHGLTAARRSGAVPVAIATTYPEEALFLKGCWTFRDFTEIAC